MPGAELDIALLAGPVAILALGPGSPSLDRAVGLDSNSREGPPHLSGRRVGRA